MQEESWVAVEEVADLRNYLGSIASERQTSLLTAAVLRSVGAHPCAARMRAADAIERFVDGLCEGEKLAELRRGLPSGSGGGDYDLAAYSALKSNRAWAAAATVWHLAGGFASEETRGIPVWPDRQAWSSQYELARRRVLSETWRTLRCIVGDAPARIEFAHAWRTSIVVSLAEKVYSEQTFEVLPILADALEDAGCDHPDILRHCRHDTQHARGCWVVDGILGKS